MSTIYRIAEQHRRELLRGARRASSDLVAVYSDTHKRLRAEIDQAIAEHQAHPTRDRAFTLYRLRQLRASVETELRRYADLAGSRITADQRTAIAEAQAAQRDIAAELPPVIGDTYNLVPNLETEALAGFLADGSPLNDVLRNHARDAAALAARELQVGLASGAPARQIARNIRAISGANLYRVLTVARTETLRAYREVTYTQYQENDDILSGWVWICGLQPHSCAACVAMHGTVHTLDERLNGHPNCGCAMAPIVADIPVEEQMPPMSGDEWLRAQAREDQESILGGRAAAYAYASGEAKLEQFIGTHKSRKWGDSVVRRSMTEIVGKTRAVELRREALSGNAFPNSSPS